MSGGDGYSYRAYDWVVPNIYTRWSGHRRAGQRQRDAGHSFLYQALNTNCWDWGNLLGKRPWVFIHFARSKVEPDEPKLAWIERGISEVKSGGNDKIWTLSFIIKVQRVLIFSVICNKSRSDDWSLGSKWKISLKNLPRVVTKERLDHKNLICMGCLQYTRNSSQGSKCVSCFSLSSVQWCTRYVSAFIREKMGVKRDFQICTVIERQSLGMQAYSKAWAFKRVILLPQIKLSGGREWWDAICNLWILFILM